MTKVCNVFVYGTLRKPTVLLSVISRIPNMQSDRLRDFRRAHLHISNKRYFVAEPYPGVEIPGYLLENVTERELALLDDYETAAYKRRLVTLGSGTTAWVYCRNIQDPNLG